MLEFLAWGQYPRVAVTLLLTLCILVQTTAWIVSAYRRPRTRAMVFESLLELFVLLQVFSFSLMQGHLLHAHGMALGLPAGNAAFRVGVMAAVALAALWLAFSRKRPAALAVVPACAVALPVAERLGGGAYPWLYVGALFVLLARGAVLCAARYKTVSTSLSALSVKNAVDTLPSGMLLCEPDGHIVLINKRMQRLMLTLTGAVQRDGVYFYMLLAQGAYRPGYEEGELDGKAVCLLPDETVWMFSKAETTVRRKTYVQISAVDVTQRWRLTQALKAQNSQLLQKSEEIKAAIASLDALSREKETQAAKMRAHDILGNRLALILRTLDKAQAPDSELLLSLAQGLLGELGAERLAPSPMEELARLQKTFGVIGVAVRHEGTLPEDPEKSGLFVQIIQEGVTNAVRHGFATEILIQTWADKGVYHLEMTNNGHAPPGEITPGGGIGGMRRKVEPYGGTVSIAAIPCFTLFATLPGGAGNV